jgi:K(+)-stimulated pyrophosphate-energized sodium pump
MRKNIILSFILLLISTASAFAGEADLKIPDLNHDQNSLLMYGLIVCALGVLFGVFQFTKVKKLHAHKSMLDVAQIIFEPAKHRFSRANSYHLLVLSVYIFLLWSTCVFGGVLDTDDRNRHTLS